jgi:hypothetical protein
MAGFSISSTESLDCTMWILLQEHWTYMFTGIRNQTMTKMVTNIENTEYEYFFGDIKT